MPVAQLAAAQRDPPDMLVWLRPSDLRIEDDALVKAMGPCKGMQIVEDQRVAGVIGVGLGDREVEEGRVGFRGDQLRRLVHRRAGILDVPDAAELAVPLDHVEGNAGPAPTMQ
jgi:hypothetical protein